MGPWGLHVGGQTTQFLEETPSGCLGGIGDGFEAMKLAQPDLESMIHEKCLGAHFI